jgi:hypothetical protein
VHVGTCTPFCTKFACPRCPDELFRPNHACSTGLHDVLQSPVAFDSFISTKSARSVLESGHFDAFPPYVSPELTEDLRDTRFRHAPHAQAWSTTCATLARACAPDRATILASECTRQGSFHTMWKQPSPVVPSARVRAPSQPTLTPHAVATCCSSPGCSRGQDVFPCDFDWCAPWAHSGNMGA